VETEYLTRNAACDAQARKAVEQMAVAETPLGFYFAEGRVHDQDQINAIT
jgi:hypothetical protein